MEIVWIVIGLGIGYAVMKLAMYLIERFDKK
jgi:hypothetical protein